MPFTGKNVISTLKLVVFIIGFFILVTLLMLDDDGYIFIIDDANLLFHEAGHLIFGLFGDDLGLKLLKSIDSVTAMLGWLDR